MGWLLKSLGEFLCGKLTKPCCHATTFQLVNQRCMAIIKNKNTKMLTKRPPLVTTVPSGTQRYHWALVYHGKPSGFRSRPGQSNHLPGALLFGDYWQSVEFPMSVPTFNSTENELTFTIYDSILRIPPERCVIWRNLTFTKMKMMNLQHFCIFMYIWWHLKFFFFWGLWKAYETLTPCQNFPPAQLAKLGKY